MNNNRKVNTKCLINSNVDFFVFAAGNGDILSYEDALLRREQTGVSGLMVARYSKSSVSLYRPATYISFSFFQLCIETFTKQTTKKKTTSFPLFC